MPCHLLRPRLLTVSSRVRAAEGARGAHLRSSCPASRRCTHDLATLCDSVLTERGITAREAGANEPVRVYGKAVRPLIPRSVRYCCPAPAGEMLGQ